MVCLGVEPLIIRCKIHQAYAVDRSHKNSFRVNCKMIILTSKADVDVAAAAVCPVHHHVHRHFNDAPKRRPGTSTIKLPIMPQLMAQ